jgi:hypothetical protein
MSAVHTAGQRAQFEMTEAHLERLLAAMQPVPYMVIGGIPRSVQENANDAWKALGDELGFVWDTAAPVPGKNQRVFSAITKSTAAPIAPSVLAEAAAVGALHDGESLEQGDHP